MYGVYYMLLGALYNFGNWALARKVRFKKHKHMVISFISGNDKQSLTVGECSAHPIVLEF